jgi:hypothetical protein
VGIHLRMHSPTSIVKFCLRCLGLAVSIFELSNYFFHTHPGCRLC